MFLTPSRPTPSRPDTFAAWRRCGQSRTRRTPAGEGAADRGADELKPAKVRGWARRQTHREVQAALTAA